MAAKVKGDGETPQKFKRVDSSSFTCNPVDQGHADDEL